jgi:hypothetical protein
MRLIDVKDSGEEFVSAACGPRITCEGRDTNIPQLTTTGQPSTRNIANLSLFFGLFDDTSPTFVIWRPSQESNWILPEYETAVQRNI